MRRECRERFSHHWVQRKPRVSDPDMHHGTCVTHMPWCMSGSLTRGDGETFSQVPAHAQPAILRNWQEAHALTPVNLKCRPMFYYKFLYQTCSDIAILAFPLLSIYFSFFYFLSTANQIIPIVWHSKYYFVNDLIECQHICIYDSLFRSPHGRLCMKILYYAILVS